MAKNKSKLVYSTAPDWQNRPQEQDDEAPQKQGTVYLQRVTKGRGGKTVTLVKGLAGDLKRWKKELQQVCGAGGTVKESTVEIQGDHRQKIAEYLKQKGLKSKMAGG
ncbi:stress response translation initiation inhibitor YciH [Caldithrix abyssi]